MEQARVFHRLDRSNSHHSKAKEETCVCVCVRAPPTDVCVKNSVRRVSF